MPYVKMREKLRPLSRIPSLPGLEPGTSGLEVQRARPLRHRDLTTSSASGPELKKHIPPASLPSDASILLILCSLSEGRKKTRSGDLCFAICRVHSVQLPPPHPLLPQGGKKKFSVSFMGYFHRYHKERKREPKPGVGIPFLDNGQCAAFRLAPRTAPKPQA